MIIAIDNNVLFSLLSDNLEKGNLETFLQQNDATLLIPTPVVAEFTAFDFNMQRQKLFSIKHSKIIIGDLNQKAALICGHLNCQMDRKDLEGKKQKVKVDLQIVSIAIAYDASIILSEDVDVKKIVQKIGSSSRLQVYARKDMKLGLDLFDD